jgi:hypothetical protein
MTKRECIAMEHWRAALSHVMTTEGRRHEFQAPELDPNSPPGETKLNIDTGGWVRLEDAKIFLNGNGWRGKFNAKRLDALDRGRKFRSGLVPYDERGRKITTNDITQVIVHSDKDRYRCMCQVNPYAGIKIPHWFACEHGHSLKTVDPLRTSLLIMDHGGLDVIPFVGEPTHTTDDEAISPTASATTSEERWANGGYVRSVRTQ